MRINTGNNTPADNGPHIKELGKNEIEQFPLGMIATTITRGTGGSIPEMAAEHARRLTSEINPGQIELKNICEQLASPWGYKGASDIPLLTLTFMPHPYCVLKLLGGRTFPPQEGETLDRHTGEPFSSMGKMAIMMCQQFANHCESTKDDNSPGEDPMFWLTLDKADGAHPARAPIILDTVLNALQETLFGDLNLPPERGGSIIRLFLKNLGLNSGAFNIIKIANEDGSPVDEATIQQIVEEHVQKKMNEDNKPTNDSNNQ